MAHDLKDLESDKPGGFMILVTGGTGRVGRDVVRRLLDFEVDFKVLVRNPDKARRLWAQDEVTLEPGDFDDPDSLKRAMAGVATVFLLSPANLRMETQQLNVVRQADGAGVRRIVKLSAMGADSTSPIQLCRMHRAVEKAIEKTGIPWTHLRPNFFFQSLFRHARTMRSEGKLIAPARNGKASMVDTRNVALVAAVVLSENRHENRIYELTGAEALTHGDMAKILTSITGVDITFRNISVDEARKRMKESGTPDWLVEDRLGLYRVWAENDAARVTSTVSNVTYKPPFSFRQFVRDHADVFALDNASAG
jgi:uncharacterized protein YbjT (DUF2867 family)